MKQRRNKAVAKSKRVACGNYSFGEVGNTRLGDGGGNAVIGKRKVNLFNVRVSCERRARNIFLGLGSTKFRGGGVAIHFGRVGGPFVGRGRAPSQRQPWQWFRDLGRQIRTLPRVVGIDL